MGKALHFCKAFFIYKSLKSNFMALQRIFRYFLRGLLLVVPVSATVYIIVITIQWVDGLIPIKIPGLGLVTVFFATALIGMLANTIIIKPLFDFLSNIMKKIPLVNFIYTSLNDVIDAVAGDKKKFNHPVLVKFDKEGTLLKPGFVTQSDFSDQDLGPYISVYMPHSYNFSGNLFLVDKSRIIKLEGSNSQIMKYIVSAGLTGDIGKKMTEN